MRCRGISVYRRLLPCLCAAGLTVSCGRPNDAGKKSGASIQVKGSDTMVNIAQAWAEAYASVAPEVKVEVSGGGSGVGIAALERGTIDIANASRNIKEKEAERVRENTGKDPMEFVAGYDALAVYVHKDNPLDEISLGQLKEVYAEGGSTTRWSQLGVSIPGSSNDEIVRVSRQSSSGTYEFFRERVLDNIDFKLGSLDMSGSKEAVELVGATRTAIGYSGMGYATDAVKMLRIRTETGSFAPTVANTHRGTYPLARSLLMYTLGEPGGEIRRYIEWILTAAGQRIVEENGYIPVPGTPVG